LFAATYSAAFHSDNESFLLFLAAAPLVVGILAVPFLNTCTFVQECELEAGQDVFTTGMVKAKASVRFAPHL
jgi:hypothetical protein